MVRTLKMIIMTQMIKINKPYHTQSMMNNTLFANIDFLLL